MPENVTCPACGDRFLAADVRVGRTLRCLACGHAFVADGTEVMLPRPDRAVDELDDPTVALEAPDDEARGDDLPLCPGCDRRVGWNVTSCPYCGEEFEAVGTAPMMTDLRPTRRDSVPHRAGLLSGLANTALILTGLSLCSAGLLLIVSLPLGAAAYVLAEQDLGKLRAETMDSRGKKPTENARNTAVAAMLLSLLFAGMFLLIYLSRW